VREGTGLESPWLVAATAAERPGRWQQAVADDLFADVWPEYNLHGDDSGAYFGVLVPRFADFQALSMHITGPVADWQEWTGMAFPEDGEYMFPHGLAPLTVSGG
jgi:hypothetical protein